LRITFTCINAHTFVIVGAIAVAALAGCGGDADADAGPTFIAYARDFQGFEKWPSETFDDPNPGGATHVAGVRTVYLNHAPPAGATAFPIGTIIVKQTPIDGKIFGQVKRGGGYNAAGAKNWEWFELSESSSGVVSVQWHGTFPPPGDVYGGVATGGCNICHIVGAENDYVIAPGLSLMGLTMDAGTMLDASGDAADASTNTDGSPTSQSN
jgi:hypothetical protein